ncbi:unnamed protein product, partial [Tetraodon nigroviridis]
TCPTSRNRHRQPEAQHPLRVRRSLQQRRPQGHVEQTGGPQHQQ